MLEYYGEQDIVSGIHGMLCYFVHGPGARRAHPESFSPFFLTLDPLKHASFSKALKYADSLRVKCTVGRPSFQDRGRVVRAFPMCVVEPHVVSLAPSYGVDVVDRGAVCLERAWLSAQRAAIPLDFAVHRHCSRVGPRVLQHASVDAQGLRAVLALVVEVRVLDLLLEV